GVEEPAPAGGVDLGEQGVGEEAAGEEPPDAGQPVGGQGAQGVVDELVDQVDPEDDDHPSDGTDDEGRPRLDESRGSGDGGQPGDRAVADHADVEALLPEVDDGHGGQRPGGRRQVGDDEDVGEVQVEGLEGGAGVEAHPPEPE